MFSTYISKRKVTQQEVEELYAYDNAIVTTTVQGVKGIAPTLNVLFPGEDFQELPFDGNLTERDKVQLLDGYVRYWIEVNYCKGIGFHGEEYARERRVGEACTNMLDFLFGDDKIEGLLQLLYLISMVMFVVLILIT